MKVFTSLLVLFCFIISNGEVILDTISTEDGKILVEKSFSNDKIELIWHYLLTPGFSIDLPYKERKKYCHGINEFFYPNGKVSSRSHFNHGKRMCPDTFWYDDGAISMINTYNENDNLHGKIKLYNEDGSAGGEKNYVDGKLHGYWVVILPDGNKEQEGNYENGAKHGWWCEWFEDGTLKDSTLYNKGYIKESFKYYKNGQLSTHTWVLSIKNDSFPGGAHLILLEDSYTMDGKLVSQVRNGNGYTHFFDYNGNYQCLMPYVNGLPENLTSFSSEISKEKLIETKDPRYPPRKIPKKERLPFDVKKYGKLLK